MGSRGFFIAMDEKLKAKGVVVEVAAGIGARRVTAPPTGPAR